MVAEGASYVAYSWDAYKYVPAAIQHGCWLQGPFSGLDVPSDVAHAVYGLMGVVLGCSIVPCVRGRPSLVRASQAFCRNGTRLMAQTPVPTHASTASPLALRTWADHGHGSLAIPEARGPCAWLTRQPGVGRSTGML